MYIGTDNLETIFFYVRVKCTDNRSWGNLHICTVGMHVHVYITTLSAIAEDQKKKKIEGTLTADINLDESHALHLMQKTVSKDPLPCNTIFIRIKKNSTIKQYLFTCRHR